MLKTLLAHTHVRKLTRVVYITCLYYTAFDIVSDRDVRRMRHSSRFSRLRRRRSITIYNRVGIYGTCAYTYVIMICSLFVRTATTTTTKYSGSAKAVAKIVFLFFIAYNIMSRIISSCLGIRYTR